MLASPLSPPPSSPVEILSAAEIENTPWLADLIDPTWLPESAANRFAESLAATVQELGLDDAAERLAMTRC